MFNENVKLTRTRTAQTCLGKKKIQKEQFQTKLWVWVFFVPCPCWRAGTALRQVSGVATRSHHILAANTFVKPSSNAATEPAADLPLASLMSDSTLSVTYSQSPEFSDQLHFFPFRFKLWEGYPAKFAILGLSRCLTWWFTPLFLKGLQAKAEHSVPPPQVLLSEEKARRKVKCPHRGEELASCHVFMWFIYFHKQAAVSGHLLVLFIGISIELIITVSECLTLFTIRHLSPEGRALLSALQTASHRDKVQMMNACCTWHLVTGLFVEIQLFNHILKQRIWAQFDLFWTVPFSSNIKYSQIENKRTKISTNKTGNSTGKKLKKKKISSCSSLLKSLESPHNISSLKNIKLNTVSPSCSGGTASQTRPRALQHPSKHLLQPEKNQDVSQEVRRQKWSTFIWTDTKR